MKQVNVLMEEELLNHLEKLSQVISLLTNKKITVSDVVRKSVMNYSKYKKVIIESDAKSSGLQINIKPATPEDYKDLPNDKLMQQIINEEW